MTVWVCVWFPKKGNIGHASLWVDGGEPKGVMYLSRWPGSLTAALLIGKGANNTYDDDVSSEGGEPSEVILRKLDETSIKAAMKIAHATNVYNTWNFNCAKHVALCLKAGIPSLSLSGITDKGVDMTSLGGVRDVALSTPPGVYAYAQLLRPEFG